MTPAEKAMQTAWDGLFAEMRRGGVKFTKQNVPQSFSQHRITSINGVEDVRVCSGIELREEIGADMVYRNVQRVPRLRFIIGVYGWRGSAPDRRQFPQPRKGFDYVRIVDAILKHVEWVRAKTEVETTADKHRRTNERKLRELRRKYPDSDTTCVHVNDNGAFEFHVTTLDAPLIETLYSAMKGR